MPNRHALSAAIGLAAMVALLSATPARAQLANASASTLALAGNNTATTHAFGAISVNPAGLARPGSGFSLALATPQVRLGLDPISLSDLNDFEGRLIPDATKTEWLDRVIEAGGESGTVGFDASIAALTFGNFGVQFSTIASADLDIPTGLVEAALFGNAGRTGTPTDLSLAGASVEGFATSTIGVAYAMPVSPVLTVGVTGKYTLGHAVAVGRTVTGLFESDPVRATADAPLVTSCDEETFCEQDFFNGGSGVGLDLGAIAEVGGITVAASLQNLVNTFSWDETKLGFRAGTLLLEEGELTEQFDEIAYADAPADIRAVIEDFTYKPSYRLGAAFDVSPMLTLTGDIHGRFSDDGIAIGPKYHTGVGAELRLSVLELRAGISKISDAMQYGGGVALVLGPVNLALAGGLRRGDLSDMALGQFTLSFGDN